MLVRLHVRSAFLAIRFHCIAMTVANFVKHWRTLLPDVNCTVCSEAAYVIFGPVPCKMEVPIKC